MLKKYLLVGAAGLMPFAAFAAIVGTNEPARPLTRERLTEGGVRPARLEKYLNHSDEQWHADQAAFMAEMKQHKVEATSSPPPADRHGAFL